MADPPRQRPQASFQRRVDQSDRSSDVEKEPLWSEARSSDLPSESEVDSEFVSENSEYSMSAAEIDDDDLLDDEEEYQRDLADQRRADEKNGHFVDDGRLHSLAEIEEMKKKFLRRMERSDLAVDEEYRKEMEEDRIADQKNGHFVEETPPRPSPARQKQVAGKAGRRSARISARVAAYEKSLSSRVSGVSFLDAKVVGGKSESAAFATQNANENLQYNHSINMICPGDTESGRMAAIQDGKMVLSHPKNNTTVSAHVGDSAMHGTNKINSPLVANSNHPKEGTDPINAPPNQASLQLPNEVNNIVFKVISSNSCLGSGDKSGTFLNEDLERVEHDTTQQNRSKILNQMPRENASEALKIQALEVAPLSSFAADEACNMDLIEAQPLLHQNGQQLLSSGPPTSGPDSFSWQNQEQPNVRSSLPAQVTAYSAFSHFKPNPPFNILSRPTFPNFNTSSNFYSPRPNLSSTHYTQTQQPTQWLPNLNPNFIPTVSHQPNTSHLNPNLSNKNNIYQPNSNSRPIPSFRNSKPPLPNLKAQNNKNKSKSPLLANTPAGKEIAANLFEVAKRSQQAANRPHSRPPTSSSPKLTETSDFPPLISSANTNEAVSLTANGGPNSSMMENSGTPENASPSWADLVGNEENLEEVSHNIPPKQPGQINDNNMEQPQIFFGKSMADVLKMGQPAEGPIFLNRERAEKRGEVRIVEGKPCLYFSANETSILAGRLGPAIVGKFSHSIPSAHQIQKALGNLKLVGTMTWNFLNAKHIFIQLSDMRDYVKMLNGPNNSPVWYVEHHPMRVFKWTPEFDPFFETPIVTLWCNILALPVHLFEESSLIAIGEMLGKPVQVDHATISRTRVSFARICVEVDLTRPIPEEIDISIAGRHVTLKVKWDKIPLYCIECKHVGHSAMTCYASGKRPMPPKRDYSQGGPNRPNAPPQGEGRPGGQPTYTPNEADRQAREPKGQANRASERPSPKLGQPHHPGEHSQGPGPSSLAPGYDSYIRSSGINMEVTHSDGGDGFTVPKKKKKTKSAARRQRERERRRLNKQKITEGGAAASDGGGNHTVEEGDASSGSEMSTRSLSPSHRSRTVDGSLAMVVHDSNMFGVLRDSPSEDDEVNMAMVQDTAMVETSSARSRQTDYGPHHRGHISPPPEGTPKRARLEASGSH